jgi:hypothetical protein
MDPSGPRGEPAGPCQRPGRRRLMEVSNAPVKVC